MKYGSKVSLLYLQRQHKIPQFVYIPLDPPPPFRYTTPMSIAALSTPVRYRTRNLHDGRPVPPSRPVNPRHSKGYTSPQDRCDAIICRHGHVFQDGSHLDWTLITPSPRSTHARLRKIRLLDGCHVSQIGDTEAAGTLAISSLPKLLRILEPYTKREPSTSPPQSN